MCNASVFGKVEIIGHTLIHAALIVFLLEGPGHFFRPPTLLHRTMGMRMAFATVNFTIVTFLMLWGYSAAASHVEAVATAGHHHEHALYEVPRGVPAPTLKLEATRDSKDGWNLRLMTTNFAFAPSKAGGANEPGHGHAHMHVDGAQAGRIYSEWYRLPPLPPGEHTIDVQLSTNDHNVYAVDGKPVEASVTVKEE